MSEENRYLGKKVIIYYDDKVKVSRLDGVCTYHSTVFVEIDYKTSIPVCKIVRVELR